MNVDLWLHGVLTARAVLKSRKVVIEYTDEGQHGYGSGAPILSCSLPALPGPNSPAVSRSFLEGLLPEGRALQTAAARLRGVELDLAGAACIRRTCVRPSVFGRKTNTRSDGHPNTWRVW